MSVTLKAANLSSYPALALVSSMHHKLSYTGAWYAKYKTVTGNLKSPNARPVVPSRHTLELLRSPHEESGQQSLHSGWPTKLRRLLSEESKFRVGDPTLKATK